MPVFWGKFIVMKRVSMLELQLILDPILAPGGMQRKLMLINFSVESDTYPGEFLHCHEFLLL